MNKSVKVIIVMGVISSFFLLIMYLVLVQNSDVQELFQPPENREFSSLCSQIQILFGIEKVSISQTVTSHELEYRVICESIREMDTTTVNAVGIHVWKRVGRRANRVEVIYKHQTRGCTSREKIYHLQIPAPSELNPFTPIPRQKQ